MKKLLFICLSISSYLAIAQHKGNYDQNAARSAYEISRQNIATSKNLGNAIVYGQGGATHHNKTLNPSNSLTIDLKALCNVKASSYTAIFNISQIGITAEETHQLMKERIDNVKKELTSAGIQANNLVIDVISFVPVYEIEVQKKLFSKKYNEIPKGFELQQNVHIQFTKTNQFEQILAACAKNEIYNLVKVDYFIKDIHLVYKKLQDALLKQVESKRQFYKTLGFNFSNYDTRVADHKYCYFPKDFYRSYQAFNSVSFEAIKKKKGVTKAKKQTSYYYQPITYENYDVVLNPSILEPVVQVGMDIKLVYHPKPKETPKKPESPKVNNKYFVISPNGNIDIQELRTK